MGDVLKTVYSVYIRDYSLFYSGYHNVVCFPLYKYEIIFPYAPIYLANAMSWSSEFQLPNVEERFLYFFFFYLQE